MALSSVMVTCLALSTAVATCCWCSCERNGRIWAIMAFNLFAISVWKQKGERSLLKGRPTVFNGGWSANRALLNWTEREDNDCPFPSHSFSPSPFLFYALCSARIGVSIINPWHFPLPSFVARDRGSVHYLIRVLLSPEAFSIDRLARIVGLCARDLYRGSRVNPATRV